MIYTLSITAEESRDVKPAICPVKIETITLTKDKVTESELDMVATAFQAQVRDLVNYMAGKEQF